MKSMLLKIVFFSAISCIAIAHETACEKKDSCFTILFKDGVFYPQDSVLRSIFSREGHSVLNWFEGAMRFQFCQSWAVEASGSYAKHKGRALCGDEGTEVKLPTVGFGLKYFFGFCDRIQFFLGAGLRAFFYREYDDSAYVAPCVKENKVGGMVNGGVDIAIRHGFFAHIFLDYNFKKLESECDPEYLNPRCAIQLGGLVAGLGLGCKF